VPGSATGLRRASARAPILTLRPAIHIVSEVAMTISFYSTRDAYGGFSNFSRHGFTLKGL
jgi:hypothetical protein